MGVLFVDAKGEPSCLFRVVVTRRGWCGSGSMLRSLRGMTEIGTICTKPAASRSSRSGSRMNVTTPAPRKFKPSSKQHGEVRPKLGAVKKKILGPLAVDACAWASVCAYAGIGVWQREESFRHPGARDERRI